MDHKKLTYIYNNDGISIHTSNINDLNLYYIDNININNWPFIVNNKKRHEINFISKGEITLNETFFLLKLEIHNAGHLIVNILYQLYFYINNIKNMIINIQSS